MISALLHPVLFIHVFNELFKILSSSADRFIKNCLVRNTKLAPKNGVNTEMKASIELVVISIDSDSSNLIIAILYQNLEIGQRRLS